MNLNQLTTQEGVDGYQKCLADLVNFLKEETQMDAEKRHVSAIRISDKFISPGIAEVGRKLRNLETKLNDEIEVLQQAKERIGA